MTAMLLKNDDFLSNPLDIAESVVMDRDWAFDRPGESELITEMSGKWCNYRIWFTWQQDSGGLMLSCALESKCPKQLLPKMHALLALVNEKMWLGHFDISSEDASIIFRHSLLLRNGSNTSSEHLQDILDIAIEECERFYPAFQSVVWGGKAPAEALEFSLFETIAEA
jgi:hypothetical protein